MATEPKAKTSPRATVAWLAGRFRNRPDTEHEMILNRVVIAVLILAYLVVASALHRDSVREPLLVSLAFAIFAVGFFVDLVRRPGVSIVRRSMAMTVDLVALSYGMHVGGGITALLYPMYLWTIFGNGFRFGLRYLLAATALAVLGFGIVIYETDYWHSNLALGIGLLGGLIILPLYAATLIRKLSDARRTAENASRAKSMFLASVSHELRTPLNAVIGMSDLLRETRMDAEQQDMAATIGTSARALLALINQILDFSRLEAGRMPMEKIDFDLHELLAEVKAMVATQARAKGLQLGLHISPRAAYRLNGDRRHLQDILINLVSNAVKFTEAGSVVVSVDGGVGEANAARLRFEVTDTGIGISPDATGRIFESFTQADETIINRFGGTGLGLAICKQLAEMLGGTIGVRSELGVGSTFWLELEFQPSAQPADSTVPAVAFVFLAHDPEIAAAARNALAGTSLTISDAGDATAAKRLLAAAAEEGRRALLLVDERLPGGHETAKELTAGGFGPVSAALVRDGGEDALLPDALRAVFVAGLSRQCDREALLAVANMARGQRHGEGTIGNAVAQASARPLSILVAEDNKVNQKVIAKILERGGHQVRLAGNGEEAVDLLLAESFDVVLMDVNMPIMSGVEATKLYRFAALGRERVPIVALTADVTPDAFDQCIGAGMDAVLPKPVEAAELFATLERLTASEAEAKAPAADEKITDIAVHPKFRNEVRAPVDAATLAELESLGGDAFVAELAGQFVEEGGRIVAELRDSVAGNDIHFFRDRIHALRSSAANIGARGLYDLCLALRAPSEAEFLAQGARALAEMEAEFQRVEKTLLDYRSRAESGEPAASASVTRLARTPV